VAVTRLLPIAFIGFVVLGMPRAAEGVAWPSMADELDQRLGALGWLIALHIAGYFVASVANGEVTRRIGTGRALVTSGVMASLALAGYAIAPNWPFLLSAAVILGFGGGLIDAAMNAHVALNHGARAMGWLHASFGLGATLAPLIMTWLITDDAALWREGFGLLAGIQLVVTVAFWRTRRRWDAPGTVTRPAHRRPAGVLALLTAFLLVAGIEGGAGAWTFTFLTEGRSISDPLAGLLVTGFFASFTFGRVTLGIAGDRFAPGAYLAFGKAATLAGVALFWWNPSTWVSGLGLAVLGFGVAPIFPILIVMTPAIVSAEHAHDVVGYELGAATIGTAVIPAIIGVTVDVIGMHTIPVVLLIVAVLQAAITPGRSRHH